MEQEYTYTPRYLSRNRSSEMTKGDDLGFNIYIALQFSITDNCWFWRWKNVVRYWTEVQSSSLRNLYIYSS